MEIRRSCTLVSLDYPHEAGTVKFFILCVTSPHPLSVLEQHMVTVHIPILLMLSKYLSLSYHKPLMIFLRLLSFILSGGYKLQLQLKAKLS